MQIQVSRLRETMDLVKPVIPKKTKLPVTQYVHLGNGKATATDLETMIIAELPEAQEEMLLPFFSLADTLKYIPAYEMLTIEVKEKEGISLSWPEGNSSYPTKAPADFPVLPELKPRGDADIDGDLLVSTMMTVLPYAATGDNRPVLNGVTVILGNPIEVAAGDGYRLAHRSLGISFPLETKVIIPEHSVSVLGHVFAKTPRPPTSNVSDESIASAVTPLLAKRQVHISLVGEEKLLVNFGKATVAINLIAGDPPEWLSMIPKLDPVLQSMVFAPQLETAIHRVRAIAVTKEGGHIVRMEFADGKIRVSAQGDDKSISVVVDAINTTGEPGRMGINYRYMADYLVGKQGIITISKYDDVVPVSFQDATSSPRVLIMPMNVDWEGKKKTEDTQEPEEVEESEGGEEKPTAETDQEPEAGEEEPVAAGQEASGDKSTETP